MEVRTTDRGWLLEVATRRKADPGMWSILTLEEEEPASQPMFQGSVSADELFT